MKNDEVLLVLRDDMNELAILDLLNKISGAQHRLIQISITAGAKVAQPYMNALIQSTQNLEGAIYILRQSNMPGGPIVGAPPGAIIRPQ